MRRLYNLAVIGSTGSVGEEIISILHERNFPVNNLYPISSASSKGQEIEFKDQTLRSCVIEDVNFEDVDIVFSAVNEKIAQELIPNITKYGCVVIDKSTAYRMDKEVPLIVPEANIHTLGEYRKKNIIASPNCAVIPLAVALKPLDNFAKLKRLVISTYQSTSGAGKKAMDELYQQTKEKYNFGHSSPSVFPKNIAFNLFPHVGSFCSNGNTSEEEKIALELAKILGPHAQASVTCARVPVFIGHSASVNAEFSEAIDADEAKAIFNELDANELIVYNNHGEYITPQEAAGTDQVYIMRLRDDATRDNSINFWVTTDNIRKGAALNGVQIAEHLIKEYLC